MTKAGKPKWRGMPVVLVDATDGRESTAKMLGGHAAAELATAADEGGRQASRKQLSLQAHASYANSMEAELAVRAAYAVCAAGDMRTVALLTPYRGQVRSPVLAAWRRQG